MTFSLLRTIVFFSAILGLICALILYPIIYILHKVFIAPFKSKKYIKNGDYKQVEAFQRGRVSPYPNGQGNYVASYEYEVDGKKYSTVLDANHLNFVSSGKTLYYHKNPQKADDRIEYIGKIEYPKNVIMLTWAIMSVILFIVFTIIMVFNK